MAILKIDGLSIEVNDHYNLKISDRLGSCKFFAYLRRKNQPNTFFKPLVQQPLQENKERPEKSTKGSLQPVENKPVPSPTPAKSIVDPKGPPENVEKPEKDSNNGM